MAELEKFLIPSETPVVRTHRHWASLSRDGAIYLGCLLISWFLLAYLSAERFFSVSGVVLLLGSSAWFAVVWHEWRTEQFVITDKRVLLINGILTRRVAIMPLTKVTDLTYERSLMGRVLGYGAFVMESAGQVQALSRIDYLPEPDTLYHDVSVLLFGPRQAARRSPRAETEIVDDEHPTRRLPPQQ